MYVSMCNSLLIMWVMVMEQGFLAQGLQRTSAGLGSVSISNIIEIFYLHCKILLNLVPSSPGNLPFLLFKLKFCFLLPS